MSGIRKVTDALKRWADEHREWIIIGVALPAGTAASALERARSWFRPRSRPADQEERVGRIRAEVRRYAMARAQGDAWAQKPLRTDRKGAASLNVRMSDKSASQTVNMSDLTNILEVDETRGIIRVEPFVTVGDAAAALDEQGLQLEATIEMKDATLGGLVMALGMTTHSHVCGLVHDTVTAYEIVTAKGELLRVTADNEHADLFRALPWSHGTLGLLVALEMRVIAAPSHVNSMWGAALKNRSPPRALLKLMSYRSSASASLASSNEPLASFFLATRHSPLATRHSPLATSLSFMPAASALRRL